MSQTSCRRFQITNHLKIYLSLHYKKTKTCSHKNFTLPFEIKGFLKDNAILTCKIKTLFFKSQNCEYIFTSNLTNINKLDMLEMPGHAHLKLHYQFVVLIDIWLHVKVNFIPPLVFEILNLDILPSNWPRAVLHLTMPIQNYKINL